MTLFLTLALQSAGVAVGTFVGALIGLSVRRRNGNTGGLFRGSVVATSFLAAMAALGAMMVVRFIMLEA